MNNVRGYIGVPLIGIVGAAGAGKTEEVSRYLSEHYHTVEYSSADPIKDIFQKYYAHGMTEGEKYAACYTQEGKASPHPYLTAGDVEFVRKTTDASKLGEPVINRQVLEAIGDGVNRVDSLVLMRQMLTEHRQTGRTMVDSSTREEAQSGFIRDNGGIIVYVKRDVAEAKAGGHHTQTFYQRTAHDYVLDNNGTIAELREQIDELVEHLQEARLAA